MSCLNPEDRSENFLHYFSKYERNLRAFVASQVFDWDAIDEVMQSLSLVMWRKFDEFDRSGPDRDFLKWAFFVARFEVLKHRTKVARDRLEFSEDVEELLLMDAEGVAREQSDRERALRDCLEKLPMRQRQWVDLVYGAGLTIRETAERVGRTPTAMYKALARIRDGLHACIERAVDSSATEGGQSA